MRIALAILLALLALVAPVAAQAPPPVPALPDAQRLTSYNLSSSTCTCSVGFAIYGDGTDVDQWIDVFVGGVAYLSTDTNHAWSLSSATGSLGSIPRPITNAVLTFAQPQTGTVLIVGARRPRRASQFPESRGVTARELNQVITDVIAQNRETWDKLNTAIVGQPGEPMRALPAATARINQLLGFDQFGQPALYPVTGSGGGGVLTPPVTVTVSSIGYSETLGNSSIDPVFPGQILPHTLVTTFASTPTPITVGMIALPNFGTMNDPNLFYQTYATSLGNINNYVPFGIKGQISSYESTIWTSQKCGQICGNDAVKYQGDSGHAFGSSIIMNNGASMDILDGVVQIDTVPGFTVGINTDFIRNVAGGAVAGAVFAATGPFKGDTAVLARPGQWTYAFDAGGNNIKNISEIFFSAPGVYDPMNPGLQPAVMPYVIDGNDPAGLVITGGCTGASCVPRMKLFTSQVAGQNGEIAFYNNTGDNTKLAMLNANGFFDAASLSTSGNIAAFGSTALVAGGNTAPLLRFSSIAAFGIYMGSGAPTISAAQGSLYVRSDGNSTSSRLYVNTNGTTGWTAVTTGL